MKRFLIALSLAVCVSFPAVASPNLVSEWGTKASDLHTSTAQYLTAIDHGQSITIDDTYLSDIGRFATTAGHLGGWINATKGPKDLGCIFRGMAEEGEVQLDALDLADTRKSQRTALLRLVTMFADAEMVASISTHQAPLATHAKLSAATQSCRVNMHSTLNALKMDAGLTPRPAH